jgi:hypothetical protein
MLRRTLTAAATAALVAVPTAAVAAPGDPDPTFGTAGIALDSRSFLGNDVAVTPDGGAVIATEAWTLVKLRADGTRDPAFGDGGVASLIDPEQDGGDVRALALDAEGRILAAGTTNGSAGADSRFTSLPPTGRAAPSWPGRRGATPTSRTCVPTGRPTRRSARTGGCCCMSVSGSSTARRCGA